ncbi:MAG: hypothetical protein SCK57_11720 [Bacillota bacterium]|nr:hypothetical protein [Bacillota bacterium]MDW7678319.1 hypothetical protein [Bacillota bacterium]
MMNRTANTAIAMTAVVSMIAAGFGFWMKETEPGRSAVSQLATLSVDFLMTVIHVMVDACRMFAA